MSEITQTSQSLYQALWNSADVLRSKMDANDYKSYLLGMIFYKFLSDKLLFFVAETMEEDTEVKIEIDPEKLYYNMVEAKATWLYELPQWDAILTPEKRKELYKNQKASGTVRKAKKIFPNDPCPCGSGKKYKKCCGKNA